MLFVRGGWHGFALFGKLSERSNNGMRTVIELTIGLAVMAGSVQAATLINTCPFVISSAGITCFQQIWSAPAEGLES